MSEPWGEIDWAAYPAPLMYRPQDVPIALRALAVADDEVTARAATSRMLFAIGNDHAGTLYTAAVTALPFVLDIALHGDRWSRWAALEVLIDAHLFGPDVGCDAVMYEEAMMPLHEAVARIIRPSQGALRRQLEAESCTPETRISLKQLLSDLEPGPDDDQVNTGGTRGGPAAR